MSTAPHTALSYSKWDMIDDSDDEIVPGKYEEGNKKVEPLLGSQKSHAHHEKDDMITQRFMRHFKEFLPAPADSSKAPMLARFIAICDKGDAPVNIYRYNDIIGFCARYGDELLGLSTINLLCELHQRMINGAKSVKAGEPPADLRALLDAINALEACRRYPNAAHFFEAVCTPSKSAEARKAAEVYAAQEFAKRAVMRHIFKNDDVDAAAELDLDDLLGTKPRTYAR